MKPSIKVVVGRTRGNEKLSGATVRVTGLQRVQTLNAGQDGSYLFDRPGDVMYVTSLDKRLPVTVTNHTSVPLVLEYGFGAEKLDDVLKNGGTFRIPSEVRLKISI